MLLQYAFLVVLTFAIAASAQDTNEYNIPAIRISQPGGNTQAPVGWGLLNVQCPFATNACPSEISPTPVCCPTGTACQSNGSCCAAGQNCEAEPSGCADDIWNMWQDSEKKQKPFCCVENQSGIIEGGVRGCGKVRRAPKDQATSDQENSTVLADSSSGPAVDHPTEAGAAAANETDAAGTSSRSKPLSKGVIAGIVVGAVAFLVLLLLAIFLLCRKNRRDSNEAHSEIPGSKTDTELVRPSYKTNDPYAQSGLSLNSWNVPRAVGTRSVRSETSQVSGLSNFTFDTEITRHTEIKVTSPTEGRTMSY